MRRLSSAVVVVLLAVGSARAQSAAADLDALLKASADAYASGQSAQGYQLLETVRDRARAEGLAPQEIEALLRLSLSHGFRRDYDVAAAMLTEARELARRQARPEDEARILLQLAQVAQSRTANAPAGHPVAAPAPGTTAADLAREAHRLFATTGSIRGMARAADVLVYYVPEGPEREAVRADALALPLVDGQPPACNVVHQYGDFLFGAGRLADAHVQVTRAIACFRARRDADDEANAHVSLGRIYRAHGQLSHALEEYDLAQALLGRDGANRRSAVQAVNAAAVTLQLLGRYDEARARFALALDRARADLPTLVPFLLANLSAVNQATGHYAEALAMLDEALERDPATRLLALRLTQRAQMLASLGRRDEALRDATRAVELAAPMGLEAQLAAHRVRAQVLGELDRVEEAGRELQVALDMVDQVRANAVPTDEMRRSFSEAYQSTFATAIDFLGRQRKGDAALETAERARARAFLDRRATQAGAAGAPAPATVADAQRLATRLRSTIVAYWVGPTTVSIWVVRAGHPVRFVRVPVLATTLTSLIRTASGLDEVGGAGRSGLLMTDRAQRAPWRELETHLITPIARWLPPEPGSRLTIVPHGPLFALSFAGLRDAAGRYLLERHDLHYAPAIALLSTPAARRAPATGALLVGDPGRLEGEPGTDALPALPWARREVEAVRASVGEPATLLIGGDATEDGVRARLSGRRVLHFATHGVVSNEPSRPSYLALHGASGVEGRLSADEIYGSTIDADLVVLSACRTALGPVEGDGVIGFTRAFLSAGARSVVATQWDVSDRVSFEVMRGFYARRGRGLSTSRALRGAQLAVLRDLRAGTVRADGVALPETPRLWAGFILTGEP